jgi:hypothetical protein
VIGSLLAAEAAAARIVEIVNDAVPVARFVPGPGVRLKVNVPIGVVVDVAGGVQVRQ